MLREIKQFYVSIFNWIASFIPPTDFNDVLILRLDELGDFVLWLDSAKEYRKLYHERRLTLLVNHRWLELAKSLNYWDQVVPLDTIQFRLNPFYRLKFLFWLRRQGFEIVICPRHSVKRTLEPAIVSVSGATQKIVCEGSFPIEKQNYFTRSIPMRPNVHELSRNADFLRGLGRKDFKSTAPKLNYSKETYNYIVICPTSLRKNKEWPLENYLEIQSRCSELCPTYLCGDKRLNLNFPENFTGKTTLMQFIELLSHAKLVIANDSAPIHLAVALDVPSICLGVENYGRFFPYQVDKPREGMILPKTFYNKDVEEITVSQVWEAICAINQSSQKS